MRFGDNSDEGSRTVRRRSDAAPTPVPPNRPANASIPELADAVQEFLTDWIIRRNYQEAASFFAPDVLRCVADSMEMNPKTSPESCDRPACSCWRRRQTSGGGRPA